MKIRRPLEALFNTFEKLPRILLDAFERLHYRFAASRWRRSENLLFHNRAQMLVAEFFLHKLLIFFFRDGYGRHKFILS